MSPNNTHISTILKSITKYIFLEENIRKFVEICAKVGSVQNAGQWLHGWGVGEAAGLIWIDLHLASPPPLVNAAQATLLPFPPDLK